MRTIRILFDETETSESIARRIVRAFNPGEIFKIRDKYYKVSPMRVANETIRANIVDDRYTLVLNVGEPEPVQTPLVPPKPIVGLVEAPLSSVGGSKVVQPEPTPAPLSEPPLSSVVAVPEPPKPTSKSGEYRIERADAAKVIKDGPPKQLPSVGQMWQTKDIRRLNSPPFTVTNVDSEFAYTDKGAKISLKRWRNYRLVDSLVEVSQQSSG